MFRIKFCREIGLKILYQLDVLGSAPAHGLSGDEEVFHPFQRTTADEFHFVLKLVNTVLHHQGDIDRCISEHLVGWKLNRLAPVDRNILRLAMAEATFGEQRAIIIDDAVRIAKKYADSESYKFINAVLDRVIP